VDEAPSRPRVDPWPWLVAALCFAAAVVFLFLWLSERSKSGGTATVPNLIGEKQAQAQVDAAVAGFGIKTVARTANRPAGTVLDQGPQPGVELEKNGQILVVVSSGEPELAVPQVTNLTLKAARAALTAAHLKAEVQTSTSDKPKDIVLSQSPPSGTKVAKGAKVLLIVSQGQQLVLVPPLQGMSQERAVSALQQAGLKVTIVQVPSTQKLGTVVAQNPPPGEKVKKGAVVQLSVSRGPAQVTVPPVQGLPSAEAEAAVRSAGLRAVVHQVPSSQPRGTVVAQNPPPGTPVTPGTIVTLDVSEGSTTTGTTTTP
jgi:beta-lactam-binding protein with PASTA domain